MNARHTHIESSAIVIIPRSIIVCFLSCLALSALAADPDVPATELRPDQLHEMRRLAQEIEKIRKDYASGEGQSRTNNKQDNLYYSNYILEFSRKIEQIGNLNYPAAALNLETPATALVNVKITADGSLQDVRILKSSGNKAIDDGVLTIVRLAAPFVPFPAEIRNETDVIEIIREWRFIPKSHNHGPAIQADGSGQSD